MKFESTETPGALANCERCKRLLKVADKRRTDSKPIRLAKVAKGVCPDCAMTQFLYETYPINMQIDEAGPELLLNPLIRQAFEMSGVFTNCEMSMDEIDWQRVVNNWSLPVKIKKSALNAYRMGESPISHLKRKPGEPAPSKYVAPPSEEERRRKYDSALGDLKDVLEAERRRKYDSALGDLKDVLRRSFDPAQEKPN